MNHVALMRSPYKLVFIVSVIVAALTGCLTDDEDTPLPPPDDNDTQGEVGDPERVPIDPKTDAPAPDTGCARMLSDENAECAP